MEELQKTNLRMAGLSDEDTEDADFDLDDEDDEDEDGDPGADDGEIV